MENDKVDDEKQTALDQAEEAAAFESSFEGQTAVAKPAEPAKPDAPEAKVDAGNAATEAKPEDPKEAAQAAAAAPATEAAPTAPSPKADDLDVKAEIRKLHGRIGALNDELQKARKTNEAEGKPAALSTVQLTRLKEEYPEMADALEGDIAEVIKGLAQKAIDPKEIQQLISKQVEEEKFVMRQEAITDRHETWEKDCWADHVGGTYTTEYQAWLNSLPKEEVGAIENSQNPAFLIRKLDQFYDWKGKAAKAETEKQQRLKSAVTPQGTARAGPQTISDEDAEKKAFEESFNQ